MSDTLQRFLFEQASVRGELVQLDASWKAVLERQDYPPAVRETLGQMMVASVLLAATMKFNGSITLQVRGNGPISMLVADCSPRHGGDELGPLYHVRGMAHWEGEVPEGDLAGRFGDGNLAITIDPGKGGKRYQGIVALSGSSVAEAIDDYLGRSEQLATRMWLSADTERAAGMLLQKLPAEKVDAESWNRLTLLAGTITDAELLELGQPELLHRLFHEEDVRAFEPQPIAFHCNCSRERVADALRGMGHDEVMDIIRSEGRVEAACQFCNRHYEFDAVDAEQLFAEVPQPGGGSTRH